jgi:O-methyltransferase
MKPVAAMWNKDYRGWSEKKREKFARLLGQLLALVDANNEGDATVHDDMAVWFRNLFFTTDSKFIRAAGAMPRVLQARMWRIYTLCWSAEQAYLATRKRVYCDIGTYDGRALDIVMRYQDFPYGVEPEVYAFDLFDGVPLEARKGSHGPGLYDEVVRRLEPWGARVHPGDIRKTMQYLPAEISWCQIDLNDADAEGSVFPAVYERLLPGAVVVFDDYGFRRYRESALRHQKFLKHKEQVLELPTGQGLLVKA